LKESIIYYGVKIFGVFIRCLPINIALTIGKFIGVVAYYFDTKHRSQVYANLKMAFSAKKSPDEIKDITKSLFKNYGQNIIELLRLPLLNSSNFEETTSIEGKEHVDEAIKAGKGVILLAMHFGSWEIASLSAAMLGHPYKYFVKAQEKYSKLNELLNKYRSCGGTIVLSRGMGTREFVKSLKNNEVIGMVVDQGGRDGVLVPFFNREASMSVGAIRMGLKMGAPLCFSIIIRENGSKHRMIIHKQLDLVNTGNLEKDVLTNLKNVINLMEQYIRKYPDEYMWFYKIWKYSQEAIITILSDGKVGHLRQSETVAQLTQKALIERNIKATIETHEVVFINRFSSRMFSFLSIFSHPIITQGRLEFLKWLLTRDSFVNLMSTKSDFIVSCGSLVAGVNNLLTQDCGAKSIVILKPSILSYEKFNLVILPRHDATKYDRANKGIAITHAAPNLINKDYLDEKTNLLLSRFSHLKECLKIKIGVFIGGDAKNVHLTVSQIKSLIHQLKEVTKEINADLLITTSRRTPMRIEQLIYKELKKYSHCPLLIIARQDNVPEAVGGILGLSDLNVVSGDSISMVSEAASSGKMTVVFTPDSRSKIIRKSNKHRRFIQNLNAEGYIYSAHINDIGRAIYDIAKNKVQTRRLDDTEIIFNAVKRVV